MAGRAEARAAAAESRARELEAEVDRLREAALVARTRQEALETREKEQAALAEAVAAQEGETATAKLAHGIREKHASKLLHKQAKVWLARRHQKGVGAGE